MKTEQTFDCFCGEAVLVRRVIFHIDVNSAFLSWEAVYRLYHLGARVDLRKIPAIVGGDQEKRHGIVLAKSTAAKRFGVQTGESVMEAKRKCPDLVVVPPNYNLYQTCSHAFFEILRSYSDRIEKYSIDEGFVDMSEYPGDPVTTAYELKDRIRRELGFTVNVGVSANKLLAKMASELEKPDKVHTIWPEEIAEKMWPLPVSELFYVGRASTAKLHALGIRTIGELAQADPDYLYRRLKSHGRVIWEYANGIDCSEVVSDRPANKGYGNSLTTARDVCDMDTARQYLLSLAETVSARLRKDGAKAQVVAVSIRDSDLKFYNHQRKLSAATDLTVELYEGACRCLEEFWTGCPLRHLGIHTSQIVYEDFRQMELFSEVDYEKQKKVEVAVDALRRKFGIDCVKRARFLDSPGAEAIDHMSGGISREKRSVDYSKETIL